MFYALTKRFRRSLGWSISVWYACGFTGGFLLVGAFAVHVTKEGDLRGDREEIREEFEQNAARCRRVGVAAFATADAREPAEVENTLLLLSDKAGGPLLMVPAFSETAEESRQVAAKLARERSFGWRTLKPLADSDLIWQVYAEPLPDGAWLQVGKSDHHWRETRERLQEALLPVIGSVLIVGLGGAILLTLRILRPVHRLIDTTRRVIRSGDMTARVPARAAYGNELDELSVLFNQMLARNEDLIRGMREALDNVAHDLRTPLTRLRNSAEAALRDRDASAQIRGEALGDAIEEAENTLNTLRVLTDISEAEHGTMCLHEETVVVRELALAAADLYEYSAEECGVRLRVEVAAELRVDADRIRLQQVIANLLDNAVKYSRSGGEVLMTAGTKNHDATVWISLRDEGLGVAEHDLPRIWDRLYRGDHSRTRRGSGLGLSLVKAIVQAHGGQVEVSSTIGVGSVFTITLPANGNSSVEST